MVTRRTFSSEFKREVVRLVKERGVAISQAARNLDLHKNVLRKWRRSWRMTRSMCFPARRR